MSFKNRLQELRKERGWTQQKLAEELGLATGTIQQYELGKRTPKAKTIKRLAEALNITPFELVGPEWFDIQAGPEKLKELQAGLKSTTIKPVFEQYLESIGYTVKKNSPEEGGFWENEIDENGDTQQVWVEYTEKPKPTITVKKGKYAVTFTEEGYQKFVEDVQKSVDFQIWDKSKQ